MTNPYIYCGNNPMMFVDPDGEFFHLIIGALIGGVINALTGDGGWDWGRFAVGAISGALSAGVGAGISSSLSVIGQTAGGFSAGFWGTSAATVATSSFTSGAVISSGAGFVSGFTSSLGNGLLSGNGWSAVGDAFGAAFMSAGLGAVTGGVASGIDAAIDGRGFIDGAKRTKSIVTSPVKDYKLTGKMNCVPDAFSEVDRSLGGNLTPSQIRTQYDLDQGTGLISNAETTPLSINKVSDTYSKLSGNQVDPKNWGNASYKQVFDMVGAGKRAIMTLPSADVGHVVVVESVVHKQVIKKAGDVINKYIINTVGGGKNSYQHSKIGAVFIWR